MVERIRQFYKLTKPGIIYGNAIHLVAGALLAYRYGLSLGAFMGVLAGTSLVIASACVANNYIDRNIDRLMARTKDRALAAGLISARAAAMYAAVLAVAGFAILVLYTNWLVVAIGVVAFIFYVVFYGWAKRHTVHSTLIGSIPGALPAMAGYVAISGVLDEGAWLIFLLVVAWQMPHFYAISLFRKKDYATARLPVLGVIASESVVRQSMVAYASLYTVLIVILVIGGNIGLLPGAVLWVGAVWWLVAMRERNPKQPIESWARVIFGRSLVLPILLLVVCGLNIVIT